MFVAGRVGGDWVRGLGLGFTNPVGTGGVWGHVCVWVTLVLGGGCCGVMSGLFV